jgi:hypothetical protein
MTRWWRGDMLFFLWGAGEKERWGVDDGCM